MFSMKYLLNSFHIKQQICNNVFRLPYGLTYKNIDKVMCNSENISLNVRNYSTKEGSLPAHLDYSDIPIDRIRNFSIIAHVDHGKSTLADRLLEYTGTIKPNSGHSQVLDKLQVERERGITVKAQSASILYNFEGNDYLLNLIDTPGHVDFSNEVSRSLCACQGVILLVDANDGVQAQTVANFYLAFEHDVVIIPVLNKIDLKNANPKRACAQLQSLFDIEPDTVLQISAKLGTGIDEVLKSIVTRLPPPSVDRSAAFKALLFDSWYEKQRGVLCLVSIKDGSINIGDNIAFCHTKKSYTVKSLAILKPEEKNVNKLVAGQIGVIGCNMRSSYEAFIGDTVHKTNVAVEPLARFKPSKPVVFAGVYPFSPSEHLSLRSAIEKLCLNDPAVSIAVETSPALGQGWRLGFLGLLHLDVFKQRLEQEYGAEPLLTAPSVTYKLKLKETKQTLKTGTKIYISNPSHFPDPNLIEEYYEPMVTSTIITPDKYIGAITTLCLEKRGIQQSGSNIDNDRIMMQFCLPLSEIIVDFHDLLKTLTSGYASFDYEHIGYHPTYLVKLDILLNGVIINELSSILHSSKADSVARKMVLHLKEVIPRQLVHIAIQACVRGKVIARENIKPYRKDVTAKLYGGDVTRKMKLLAQQAAGKKKMRMVANISLSRDTFIDIIRRP